MHKCQAKVNCKKKKKKKKTFHVCEIIIYKCNKVESSVTMETLN